jgi:serine/threonine protein kinase
MIKERNGVRLSNKKVSKIFFQVLSAVNHLHDQNSETHRVISADNILIVGKKVKLVDMCFGTQLTVMPSIDP